jgi:spore germination protein YaaH
MDCSKGASKRGGLMAALAWGGLAVALWACGLSASARGLPAAGAPLFVGFYDAWDQSDLPALPRQLAGLDVFAPRWVTIRGAQGQVVVEPDNGAGPIAARAAPRLKLMPLISNAHDDIWDQPAADAVTLDPAARKAFLARLAQLAKARGFAGYIFDFENMSPRADAAYPALLAAARAAFSPVGLQAWATVQPGPDEPFKALAASGDAAVLMAYDECWATSNAGPIAGADWLRRLLADRLSGVDPRHVVVALAAYGYDWPDGRPGQPIGAAAAIRLAARMKAPLRRDPASQNVHFAYAGADGLSHQVWFLDARAFAADRAVAAAWRPRGYALWRLGLEDPAIWSLPPASPADTSRVTPSGPPPHPCDLLKPAGPA